MAATFANPPPQRRQSRSKSISSTSLVSLQRNTSLATQGITRPSLSALRPQSPNESNVILRNLSYQTTSPESKRRLSVVYSRPNSGHGVLEGVGNLNRWSHSTASTKSSTTNTRRNSLSARLSGSFGASTALPKVQSPPSSQLIHPTKNQSPQNSPKRQVKRSSTAPLARALPQAATLASLSQAVDEAESPSTLTSITPVTAEVLTPATYNSVGGDYFGDRWLSGLPQPSKVTIHRAIAFTSSASGLAAATVPSSTHCPQDKTAGGPIVTTSVSATLPPTKAIVSFGVRARTGQDYTGHSGNLEESGKDSGPIELDSSASSIRSIQERSQRRKPPSQKAMLSKALQKANHAVLLDNAQNYEGAMDAYREACALLQQVMLRSSGDDDRRKLDAVVSILRQC